MPCRSHARPTTFCSSTRIGKTRLDKLGQLADLLEESGITPIGFAVIGTPRPRRREYSYYSQAPSNATGSDLPQSPPGPTESAKRAAKWR